MPTLLILGGLALVAFLALSRRAPSGGNGRAMPLELEFMMKQSIVQASATGNSLLLGQTGQELIRRGFPETGNRLIALGSALEQASIDVKAQLSGATVQDAANVERGQAPQFLAELARQLDERYQFDSTFRIGRDLATLANLTAIYLVEAGAEAGRFTQAA